MPTTTTQKNTKFNTSPKKYHKQIAFIKKYFNRLETLFLKAEEETAEAHVKLKALKTEYKNGILSLAVAFISNINIQNSILFTVSTLTYGIYNIFKVVDLPKKYDDWKLITTTMFKSCREYANCIALKSPLSNDIINNIKEEFKIEDKQNQDNEENNVLEAENNNQPNINAEEKMVEFIKFCEENNNIVQHRLNILNEKITEHNQKFNSGKVKSLYNTII